MNYWNVSLTFLLPLMAKISLGVLDLKMLNDYWLIYVVVQRCCKCVVGINHHQKDILCREEYYLHFPKVKEAQAYIFSWVTSTFSLFLWAKMKYAQIHYSTSRALKRSSKIDIPLYKEIIYFRFLWVQTKIFFEKVLSFTFKLFHSASVEKIMKHLT